MPKQGKTPKKKSKEKTPQKSGESEYPAMDQEELNRLVQNAIEQSQAQLQQKHEEQIKRLEADREALEERLTRKFKDEVDSNSESGRYRDISTVDDWEIISQTAETATGGMARTSP